MIERTSPLFCWMKSLVIRQKGESQNRIFKKTKHAKFSKKTNNSYRVSVGKKFLFFGKIGKLCFIESPVLRFALLPYYRRNSIKTDLRKINPHREIARINWVVHVCLHKARMLGEFDSIKNSYPAKFRRRTRILVLRVTTICFLNFKCDSNLSGLRQLKLAVGTH